jgi:calcineurin-like phosphoesterase family protein
MSIIYYEPLRLKTDNIVFIGCVHFGHDREFLWGKRGFNNVEEHDRAFIENWNKVANQDTIGFFLGDTMFGSGGEQRFCGLFERLNGREFFCMPGNHYAGYKQTIKQGMAENNGDPEYLLDGNRYINLVPNYLEVRVGDKLKKMNLSLCHYPIISPNGLSKGAGHLYSHVHGNLSKSEVGRLYENANNKTLEVSVENAIKVNNGLPFKYKDIVRLLDKKGNESFDHHSSSTNNPF